MGLGGQNLAAGSTEGGVGVMGPGIGSLVSSKQGLQALQIAALVGSVRLGHQMSATLSVCIVGGVVGMELAGRLPVELLELATCVLRP
jgi:hypothetical protein